MHRSRQRRSRAVRASRNVAGERCVWDHHVARVLSARPLYALGGFDLRPASNPLRRTHLCSEENRQVSYAALVTQRARPPPSFRVSALHVFLVANVAVALPPARGVSKDPPARPYYDVAPERTL
jgi:hypothetical protein